MPESAEANVCHHPSPFCRLGEGFGKDVGKLLISLDSLNLEVGFLDSAVVLLIEVPVEPLRRNVMSPLDMPQGRISSSLDDLKASRVVLIYGQRSFTSEKYVPFVAPGGPPCEGPNQLPQSRIQKCCATRTFAS